MRISVAIPAYNEEEYIGACLESLEKQSCPNFEVVVCLTCTDRTEEIVAGFARRGILDLKVIHEPKKGIALARQRAFEHTSGEIIASADADTEYPPWWIERIREDFMTNPQIVAVCGPVRHREAKGLARLYLSQFYPLIDALAREASERLGLVNVIGSNFAVKRKAFERVGGFDTSLSAFEDNELAKRLKSEGEILYDPIMVAYPSARRYNGLGVFRVPLWNIKNYIEVVLLSI